jgi:hypothetical protein
MSQPTALSWGYSSVTIRREAGCAPEPVWTSGREKNCLPLTGFRNDFSASYSLRPGYCSSLAIRVL